MPNSIAQSKGDRNAKKLRSLQGQFLGEGGKELDTDIGDVLISDISELHGIGAVSDLRVLVAIAPPI